MVALRLGMMVLRNFEKEVIVGLDRRHQMGIAGDQNDKNALAWVAGLVRMLNDVEQITRGASGLVEIACLASSPWPPAPLLPSFACARSSPSGCA
jgi:hypothetical protein